MRRTEEISHAQIKGCRFGRRKIVARSDARQLKRDAGLTKTGQYALIRRPTKADNLRFEGDDRCHITAQFGVAQGQPVATPSIILDGRRQPTIAPQLAGRELKDDISRRQTATLQNSLINQAMLARHRQQVARIDGQLQITTHRMALGQQIKRVQSTAQAVEINQRPRRLTRGIGHLATNRRFILLLRTQDRHVADDALLAQINNRLKQ